MLLADGGLRLDTNTLLLFSFTYGYAAGGGLLRQLPPSPELVT